MKYFLILVLIPALIQGQSNFWFVDIPGLDGEFEVSHSRRESKTTLPKSFCSRVKEVSLGFSKTVYTKGNSVIQTPKAVEEQEIALVIDFDKASAVWSEKLLTAQIISQIDLFQDEEVLNGQREIQHIRLFNVRVKSVTFSSNSFKLPEYRVKITAERVITSASQYDSNKKTIGIVNQSCFDFKTNSTCIEKL